jgi:TPP-dependent pyruvate/acetoin dehydrogenase alpha subunit
MNDIPRYYAGIYRLRRFEETILENFSKGVFFGTTHTSLGQEANAIGVVWNLRPQDVVFSNHRCHGHFLAYGGDLRALFAELMGKASGVCGGRGGSQHLQWRNFYSNGVQGGIIPIATGMALAEKIKGSQAVVVAFLGDGTLGEGVIYESFNMAALWQAPILYVVENNQIAQTTPLHLGVAGSILERFTAFGISAQELESSDVLEIQGVSASLLDQIRASGQPQALILHTHRFGPHSKGDDTRSLSELEILYQQHDPLKILAARLSSAEIEKIQAEVDAEIDLAYQVALDDPFPEMEADAGLDEREP